MKLHKALIMSLPVFIFFSTFQSKAQEQKTIDLNQHFNTIKIFDGIEAQLYPSDKNQIVISGFDEDEVNAEVDDNVLKVKMNLSNVWSKSNTKIKIYFNGITDIDVNEGSSAEIMEKIDQAQLNLRAQEGSEIVGHVDVSSLNVKSVTGSLIELKGKAKNASVQVKTGGKFKGKNLKTATTNVSLMAGGSAQVNASEYANAQVKVGGTIEIYGDPDELDRKTTLAGKIIKR